MKRLFLITSMLMLCFVIGDLSMKASSTAKSVAFAQKDWVTIYDKRDNFQFEIPSNWKTISDKYTSGPYKGLVYTEAQSPDGSMYLYVDSHKDESKSTVEFFKECVNALNFKLDGEYHEEDLNGLHAYVGEVSGKMSDQFGILVGQKVAGYILAATYDENNVAAYIFTPESKFEKNNKLMNQILDSFRPMQ